MEALRKGDAKFLEERDRRYAEVKIEQEKAIKIKETADLAALQLARQIQEYKDEKANELRSQIEREQGERATKKELQDAVEKVQAERHGSSLDSRTLLISILLVLAAVGAVISPHIH
jgi:sugar-specific transcriptional regulator TrmB